ncbi:MAG: hypothetical protein HW416_2940 [Chloroflexi bacterium]|nr:hypothetical protein [Chloroflexota bacterium]
MNDIRRERANKSVDHITPIAAIIAVEIRANVTNRINRLQDTRPPADAAGREQRPAVVAPRGGKPKGSRTTGKSSQRR